MNADNETAILDMVRKWHRQLENPRIEEGAFSTEKFLHDMQGESISSSERSKILDRLCKKVDVVKKVYIAYESDLSKARSSVVIRESYAVYLCMILICAAKEGNDLKFLNSALKMLDGGLREPNLQYPQQLFVLAEDVMKDIFAGRRGNR